MLKRIGAFTLSLMLAVTFLPAAAFAADDSGGTALEPAKSTSFTEKDSGDTYYKQIGLYPYTFYDLGGGAKKKLDDNVLIKLLTQTQSRDVMSRDASGNVTRKAVSSSILSDWSYIANRCFAEAGKCATIDTDRYEKAFFNDSPKYNCFGNIRKVLTGDATNKGKVSRDNLWGTGLVVTNSVAKVREAMARQIEKQIDHKTCHAEDILKQGPVPEGQNDPVVLKEMADNKTEQPVVYTIATSINEKSANNYTYNSFGIAFYDFAPRAIKAEDLVYKKAGDDYDTPEEAVEKGAPGVTYDTSRSEPKALTATNESSGPSSQELTYQDGGSPSISNSYTSASSYSFGQEINGEMTWKAADGKTLLLGAVEAKLGIKFSYEQMYSEEQSHCEGNTISNETTAHQGVTLEPQTSIMLTTEKTTATLTEEYDTPMMVSFKVAVFSITGDVYADNALTCYYTTAGYEHGFYYNEFGNKSKGISANENLEFRAFENTNTEDSACATIHKYWKRNGGSKYNRTDEGTDWKKNVFKDSEDVRRAKEAIQRQAKTIPMLSGGCSYTLVYDTNNNKVSEMTPLYLPKKFTQLKGETDYEMTGGDKLNLSRQITIGCLNRNEVPYYGFSQNDGRWIVCDERGDAASSDVIRLSTNGTGDQVVTAAAPGTAFVTWKMKDNVTYESQNDTGSVTAASNLPSPIIRIDVPAVAFEGTVEVGGEFTGCVGDKDVNLSDQLTAAVYDKTGKQVNKPVAWEQKELTGITVGEDGDITMDKAGTYNVRAVVRNTEAGTDDVYSDWYPITVREARELTSVEFTSPGEEDIIVMERPAYVHHVYDLKSYLRGYDQYGDLWEGDFDEVSFDTYATNKDNGYVDGDKLVIEGEGDFQVVPVLKEQEFGAFGVSTVDNVDCAGAQIKLAVGKSDRIVVRDAAGKELTEGLTFTSDAPEIAEVSEDGTVRALAAGFVEIEIRDGLGGRETCEVLITPGANPVRAAGKTVSLKAAALKKKAQTVRATKAMTVRSAQGAVTYKLAGVTGSKFKKYFKVAAKTGDITVRKGLKKGTYKVKIKVTAAGNDNYKKGSKTAAVTVKVK